MLRKVSFVLGFIVLAAALSACGAVQSSDKYPQPTINVTGNGQVYIVPDIAYINIGVHSEAEVVTDALNENNQQAQAISGVLSGMGVTAEDIQTTAFNVFPMQEYGPNGEVTNTKYGVDNSVMVTVRDLSKLGTILDAVVQAGANTINSISFDAQDKTAAYAEARRLAVENARTQAEQIAQAAGVQLGDIFSINAYSSGPTPVYDVKAYAGQGGSAVPVAAGQIVISVDANINYYIVQ